MYTDKRRGQKGYDMPSNTPAGEGLPACTPTQEGEEKVVTCPSRSVHEGSA